MLYTEVQFTTNTCMYPVINPLRYIMMCTTLCFFVFMVRKYQVYTTCMYVNVRSKYFTEIIKINKDNYKYIKGSPGSKEESKDTRGLSGEAGFLHYIVMRKGN